MANSRADNGASRRHDQAGDKAALLPERQFEQRLGELGEALDDKRPVPVLARGPGQSRGADYSNALRMSSEFVAAILVGTLLGWGVDRFAGTKPWGLIILMMLGFAAGVINVLRTAGTTSTPSSDDGDGDDGKRAI